MMTRGFTPEPRRPVVRLEWLVPELRKRLREKDEANTKGKLVFVHF